jgi:peptide/nickel transport system permease protein
MPIRDIDYVKAARAIGVSDARILFTHILPNCLSPLIVNITVRTGVSVVGVATDSFLGLGVAQPIPEWGAMLSEARNFMSVRPDLVFYPGLMILIFTLLFNLLGDGLRDALDPKARR